MYYSTPLPNTVQTDDGHKASALIETGGLQTLLENPAPADEAVPRQTTGPTGHTGPQPATAGVSPKWSPPMAC